MASILVVEDDKSMNDILVETLVDRGHQVKSAFHGLEAIELCRSHAFELVITDVRLPGMDGVETLAEIQKFLPTVKSIVITGYSSHDTPIRAIRLRVDDYLFKPFSLKYFMNSVDKVLRQEQDNAAKRTLFGKLFSRYGMTMGEQRDAKLEALVSQREQDFRALYIGIRSAYLTLEAATELYSRLESLEIAFRKTLNNPSANSLQIEALRISYLDIQEQLALLEVGAEEESKVPTEGLPTSQMRPLFDAVQASEIDLCELLYAPLLRKEPESRFEAWAELLELKRKLWPLSTTLQ